MEPESHCTTWCLRIEAYTQPVPLKCGELVRNIRGYADIFYSARYACSKHCVTTSVPYWLPKLALMAYRTKFTGTSAYLAQIFIFSIILIVRLQGRSGRSGRSGHGLTTFYATNNTDRSVHAVHSTITLTNSVFTNHTEMFICVRRVTI